MGLASGAGLEALLFLDDLGEKRVEGPRKCGWQSLGLSEVVNDTGGVLCRVQSKLKRGIDARVQRCSHLVTIAWVHLAIQER